MCILFSGAVTSWLAAAVNISDSFTISEMEMMGLLRTTKI